ncbi:MAG: hypothetical protein HQL32_17670 [Planctomycetes bacterium]|nr:hypothetical protein [Planctomycetota bacterium]
MSLVPEQIIIDAQGYRYECRRCKNSAVLPDDFAFKHPTKKNLSIPEALQKVGKKKRFQLPSWISQLFARDP